MVNTILGIGGLFDIGRALKLPKQDEDLGQTFGVWGLGPGFYLTLPFFGPSSLRDGTGRLGDAFLDPLSFISIGIWPAVGIRTFEQINKTSEEMMTASHKLAEEIYKQATAEQQAQAQQAAGAEGGPQAEQPPPGAEQPADDAKGKDDGALDADFEVVVDKEGK